jgi:hypothetical protein
VEQGESAATKDPNTAIHLFGYFRPMFIPTALDFLFNMYHPKGTRNHAGVK